MSKDKKTVQIQVFRPKDEDLKRIPPEAAHGMAEDTIKDCESWIQKKAEELKAGKITGAEFNAEMKKQTEMIRDAQKTISETENKKEER